ncbi:uL15 family ribosomal protein [bacterium]|nr:uL15 family ribosomal protein [bacterium]
MQLHQLKPTHKRKKKKRIGRGGKRGRYSGRGIKGQKSRAGRKMQPFIRELIKKYHKLRGYNMSSRERVVGVNVDVLDRYFKDGELVNPKILTARRIIRKIKGRMPKIKILGRGELKKKLVVRGCEVSKGAEAKIKKVGGTVKVANSQDQMSNKAQSSNG